MWSKPWRKFYQFILLVNSVIANYLPNVIRPFLFINVHAFRLFQHRTLIDIFIFTALQNAKQKFTNQNVKKKHRDIWR